MTTEIRSTAAAVPESETQSDDDDDERTPENTVGGPIREPQGLWHFQRADRL